MQSTNQFLLIPPTSTLSKVFVFLQDTHSSPSPCTPSFFQHIVHATVHKRATCTRSAVFLFDLSQHHCHWCSFNLHVCISSLQCGTSNRVHFLLEPCPRDGSSQPYLTWLLFVIVAVFTNSSPKKVSVRCHRGTLSKITDCTSLFHQIGQQGDKYGQIKDTDEGYTSFKNKQR